MHVEQTSLHQPTPLVVRTVARELLRRLREKSENVGVENDGDALHDFRVAVRRLRSWMRAFDDDLSATVRPKARRRLKRIADATRESRDYEVHIDWLEQFSRSRKGRYHDATEWLIDRMQDRKQRADLDLQDVLNEDLERTMGQLTQGLGHYIVRLDEPTEPFAVSLAALIREHSDAARQSISRIASMGDRNEAHEARIVVKRLRYLIEPLVDAGIDVQPLVARLAELQDDLGALHDAQIFGSEIAQLLAKVLRARGRDQSSDNGNSDAVDRADALRAISQRLHRDEVHAFQKLHESWLNSNVEPLWTEAESVAEQLATGPAE